MDQHFLAETVSPVTARSLGTVGFSQTPTYPGYVSTLGGQLLCCLPFALQSLCPLSLLWARKRMRSQIDQHFRAEFVSHVTVLTLG